MRYCLMKGFAVMKACRGAGEGRQISLAAEQGESRVDERLPRLAVQLALEVVLEVRRPVAEDNDRDDPADRGEQAEHHADHAQHHPGVGLAAALEAAAVAG